MSHQSFEMKINSAWPKFGSVGRLVADRLAFLAGTCLLLLAMQQFVLASSITYLGPNVGPYPKAFPGNTVVYGPDFGPGDQGVTEASVTDPLPLFGAPTVAGDSINFSPTGFGAFASFGSIDLTDGNLVFKILAKPSFVLNTLDFNEAGVTSLFDNGGGTDKTHTQVFCCGPVGVVNILGVDGANLVNAIKLPLSMVFSPNGDGKFELVTDAGLGLGDLGWTGAAHVDLNGALVASGVHFSKGVTLVSIDLDNKLFAQSEANTIALIDKKQFGGVSITVNQGTGGGPNGPEPTSFVLACLGFLGLLGARRLGR